ncbi:unnamed protein product [Peronospora destructor]|uniref:RNase H type-1 domain-containing protein n=1 Tax=Peronospora destructor TaxID=86335 RepID=A0AAV0TQT5_9STRA|nr:unnamed protein product [Peronospora destructor]
MPSSSETNHTAEYTALLLGARAAADHGSTHLHVEGDRTLVIQQVRGIFATRSTRLRKFRTGFKTELARLVWITLLHIGPPSEWPCGPLANAVIDRRASKMECGVHPAGHGGPCTSLTAPNPAAVPSPAQPATPAAAVESPEAKDLDNDMGDIDDGEVCAAMCVGPEAVPQRRPHLRLRKLDDAEQEAVGALVERLATTLAAKISDDSDWEAAESYINALPHALYDRLQPYTQVSDNRDEDAECPLQVNQHERCRSRRRRGRSGGLKQCRRCTRPPRVTRHHREHRLDEALDELRAVGRSDLNNRKALAKARRRMGRIKFSIAQQHLRHQFDTSEKACIDGILAAARSKRLSTEEIFTPQDAFPLDPTDERAFDAIEPVGALFRSALARLPAATRDMELLKDALTTEDIEGQVQRGRGSSSSSSSPGIDGVGYDIYKMFAAQLLPALHAAFAYCWQYKRQAIYKLYAGILARRFTRWLYANGRHAEAQKGFRALNGCGEHNFLAATLIGSCMSCSFTIGNAADGTTAPITLQVGLFQGCPLSPRLFNAAIASLLHALKRLPETGVQLSSVDRPGAAAYADDLKTFSSTVDGIKRQHSVV